MFQLLFDYFLRLFLDHSMYVVSAKHIGVISLQLNCRLTSRV